MKWYKSLLNRLKGEKKVPCTAGGSEVEEQEDTRKILTDRHGEDLVCPLCDNQDNETGKYYPVREGDKRKFHGDNWHKVCLRVFLKEARSGRMV